MIIKSHIRGGFRSVAEYLKEQGQNEKTRLVGISDPHAKDLDQAFRAMWAIADGTRAKKPLHHISINPMKDERLTDGQVQRICERLEERYGYKHGDHQRVIVEHIKEGRQHFHVIWNRVSLKTGKPHYPYKHKMQSKIAAREMEIELGLKQVTSKKNRAGLLIPRAPTPKRSMGRWNLHVPLPQHSFVFNFAVGTFAPYGKPPDVLQPLIPSTSGRRMLNMSKEQQIDFEAACDGKITWRQYWVKWGGNGCVFALL